MKKSLEQSCRSFPADAKSPEVLEPRNGALHFPTAPITSQRSAVLGLVVRPAVGAVGRDHLDTHLGHGGIQGVAIIGFVADDSRGRLSGQHEVKNLLYAVTLGPTGGSGINRDWQTPGVD